VTVEPDRGSGPDRRARGGQRILLGVDIGTSITKATVFDGTGKILAGAERPTRLVHSAGGRVEQDSDEVVRSVGEVLREVTATLGSGHAPELLAITGQGDGCWLVDGDGRPARAAISWMDGRAGDLVTRWAAEGVTDAVYRVNGDAMFPGALSSILAWLDEHEPAVLDRAASAQSCTGMVLNRLTGLCALDPSEASLPFGDGAGGYSTDVLDLFGLGHRARLLPRVVTPVPRGRLGAGGAEVTGLPEGLPVSGGPFDLPACAVGAGVSELGDGVLTIGTTLACQVLVDRVDTSGEVAGMHLATPSGPAGGIDRWLRALPAMVGTASLDWVLDMLGVAHDAIGAALADTQPGAAGVEMLPYLAPSGERAPFVDAAARGQLTGLSLTARREDVVRAVCEGIAFAARDCFAGTDLTGRLFVCGGGTRSPEWLQVFADVLGRPLHLTRAVGIGARGAVLCHLRAAGEDPDPGQWTATTEVVEPDPAAGRVYDHLFARYRAHREAAQPLWPRPDLISGGVR